MINTPIERIKLMMNGKTQKEIEAIYIKANGLRVINVNSRTVLSMITHNNSVTLFMGNDGKFNAITV